MYDLGADAGWVSVGGDGDIAQFAVQTIRRWWDSVGTIAYPGTASLLITADAGGSNGYRLRLWKKELAALADATGLAITVCHMPPGTSKWNKIRAPAVQLHLDELGRAAPTSHEVAVNLIAGTTTRTGLTVRAERDTSTYPRGIKITDREIKTLTAQYLTPHDWHCEWNYTITPARAPSQRVVHFQRLTTGGPTRTGHGDASARCVHPRLLCRVSCSGRARPMTAARGEGSHQPAAAMEREDPGQFRPQPRGPRCGVRRAGDFMRHSRPNPGLREASPGLRDNYDLAGRVEALPGDFAHPATGGMRQDQSSARPAVLASRSGSCPARHGGRRRNRPGSPSTARRPRSCRKPSGRCPARWGYAARPEANRTGEQRD